MFSPGSERSVINTTLESGSMGSPIGDSMVTDALLAGILPCPVGSQTSPVPSPSVSVWSALGVDGQLSERSGTPSPSLSAGGALALGQMVPPSGTVPVGAAPPAPMVMGMA